MLFSDAPGSTVDIAQMVGRALRLNPDHGKLATSHFEFIHLHAPRGDPFQQLGADTHRIPESPPLTMNANRQAGPGAGGGGPGPCMS
ncbi:hypothetical protein ACFYXC_41080 [Streptomyces sp. NPDC002701]|uniref:hypothetical protein n=1 Tax=Streptomyces sp. NPDC002701 TaxID=3364661 RepID=UPI0036C9BC97